MKKILPFYKYFFSLILICCVTVFSVKAQNVVRVEYFVDSDPGFGNATLVPITAGLDVTANFQFNISLLTAGFHNLYVRSLVTPFQVIENGVTVTKGGWSLSSTRVFYKETINNVGSSLPNITAAEFFTDTDPGFGNATNIPLIAGTDISNLNFTFDVTSLAIGFHNLYVRCRDANGHWSLTNTRKFYKENLSTSGNALPNITKGEYFVDTDPGFGNATNIPLIAGTEISNLNFTFDITSLAVGFHNLYVRCRDANGHWRRRGGRTRGWS